MNGKVQVKATPNSSNAFKASGILQRQCACGSHTIAGGECESCGKEKTSGQLQRAATNSESVNEAPPVVHEVLRSSWQPLDANTRAFFETRFAHDFSHVRVHTDAKASESARAVNALAYTVGSDVVFGAGHYAPHSHDGRKLLAHEMTHVMQQEAGSRLQTKLTIGDCRDTTEREADHNADAVVTGADRLLTSSASSPLHIQRACAPGEAGSTSADCALASDVPKNLKSVPPKCGPDATNWFVRQVNAALLDKSVVMIKALLSSATKKASGLGGSAQTIAEGGATAAVQAQEINLGKGAPARSGAIKSQMAAGVGSEVRTVEFGLKHPLDATDIVVDIGIAALLWRALVNHGARYDFKAHTDSMNHPWNANCPDDYCDQGEVGIITFCPGTLPQNCYESDLPGNLFYALIGRYIGWSKLTLQLGSQLAELTDLPRVGRPVITWDTPQDTAAIDLGFELGATLPLTRTALCSKITAKRGNLDAREGCKDCLDPTPSLIR